MELDAIIIGTFAASVRMITPILFTALGEIFAERSGVLNLGLEGMMVMGALAGFMVSYYTGNLWLGMFAGVLVGGILGLFMAIMCITLRFNQAVSGITVTLFGLGLSALLYRIAFGILSVPPIIEGLNITPIPLLSQIPVLGPIFFQHNIFVYAAFLSVPICTIALFKTTIGLKIRAVGENPNAADTLGINVYHIRYLCVIFCGMMTGLAGAYLPVVELKIFTEGMSAGRGWMAIALVIFGKWIPFRVFLGAALFGFVDAMQLRLQAIGIAMPYQFLVMLPYVLTIIVIAAAYKRAGAPASLTIPYKRD